jgi:hypothetical protein
MRFSTICSILVVLVCRWAGFAASDSAIAFYETGVADYDTASLQKAFAIAPDTDYLFKAGCLCRIQVIKHLEGDNRGVVAYGGRAFALLDSAETAKQDAFLIIARRTLCCMILSTTGVFNSVRYGSRSKGYLSRMKKMDSLAFRTRFLDALFMLDAPAVAGGDKQKAHEEFLALHRECPESTAVTLHLARSLVKLKRPGEAVACVDEVLKKTPRDFWAQMIRRDIEKQLK